MKIILNLIKKEFRLLYKSIIVISLILIAFLSALFSAATTGAEISANLYEELNKSSRYFTLNVYDTDIKTAEKSCAGYPILGDLDGLTRGTQLTDVKGNVFNTTQSTSGNFIELRLFNGSIIGVNDATLDLLNSESEALIEGDWLSEINCICMDKFVAESLQVEVSDYVSIGELSFLITAIYDKDLFNNEIFSSANYLISIEENIILEVVQIVFDDAQSAVACHNKVALSGLKSLLPTFMSSYMDNISTMQAFFAAIIILLGIVIIIVMYTLMAIIIRQRKTYINQLRIFGADCTKSVFVYCFISILVLGIATLLSMLFSVLFSIYFMNVCIRIFKIEFTAHYNFFIPLIVFAVLVVIVGIQYLILFLRLRAGSVANEIRHE